MRAVVWRTVQAIAIMSAAGAAYVAHSVFWNVPGPATLDAGPIVGAVTEHSAKLWVKASHGTDWQVTTWPEGLSTEAQATRGKRLEADRDFTGVLELQGLEAATQYHYEVELGGRKVTRGSFRTFRAPGTPGRLRVIFGGDIAAKPKKQPVFRQIARLKPDLVLFVGDQMYSDRAAASVEGYAQRYARNWNIGHLSTLLASFPTFMIWDDHEITDNYYAGKSERYAPARRAYELYVHDHNPASAREGKLYYRFDAGDVSFFVLDVRSDRVAPTMKEHKNKTMLGAAQKRDLFKWLRSARGRFKVIVSPVVLSRWARGHDAWNEYTHERRELLRFLEKHAIDDVLVLSGDQHWSGVFVHDSPHHRAYEFLATPLSKGRGQAPAKVADDVIALDDDHKVFGVVDFDTSVEPATLAMTLCAAGKPCRPSAESAPRTNANVKGRAENVPFTVRLTTHDMGPRP